MGEDDLKQRASDYQDEFEIDPDDDGGDLESAMQEALEAVERSADSTKGDGHWQVDRVHEKEASSTPDNEIEALQEEIVELRDRSARTLADFENFRRRVERERQDERRFAAFDVLAEFLPVVDNLERALAAEGPASDLKVGVEMILRQMLDVLKTSGVTRIEAVGAEFDPRFHEAVAHHQDPEVTVPTVAEELQAGYLMHDRLLRPAVVKVAMPVEEGSASGSEVAE